MSDNNPSEADPFGQIADEFVEAFRQGQHPSVEEFALRYPEHADEIRDILPALGLMEQAKSACDPPAQRRHAKAPAAPAPLRQLGDYEILREVGRGGMGIVYEARQLSLGRHVAIKVLASHALLDPRKLGRFEREARSAAKLHHTNIVPVYGVGEQEGLHYYVMQFIQGVSLDGVLDELRRLRQPGAKPAPSPGAVPGRPSPVAPHVSAVHLAHRLLSGDVRRPEPASDLTVAPGQPAAAKDEGGRMKDEGRQQDASSSSFILHPSSLSSGPIHLPGRSEGSTLGESGRQYWQSVARVGLQVADALAHASSQGVLHRDIKPSNLLLDDTGNVWVTDFGLAKADTDIDNLTHTGDIVGTLRFMAPERFNGQGDLRSDLYSLGLTLYELLALRPAFDETDRNKLVKEVMHGVPPRPRKLNPAVPRDLETVVLKAIDREPARRYQTAQDLADDLKRFVEDRPIRARREALCERAWRWCRHNPAAAGLAAAVAALLVVVATGATAAAVYFGEQAGTEKHLKTEAKQAKAGAEDKEKESLRTLTDMYTAFGLVADSRDDPRQAVLWFANAARLAGDGRERAEANRTRAAAWGRRAIQPVRAFLHPAEWVENNMAFHPGGRHLLTHGINPATGERDCRLWDVEREEALPFPGNPGVVSAAAWDAAGEHLAVGTPQGEVTIHRFPGGDFLQRVPFAGRITRLLFSPDGRYCALAASNRVRVWDCRQAAFATPELEHPSAVWTLAFHPSGELLATGCQDRFCRVFAVPAEKSTPLFSPVPHNQGLTLVCGRMPVPPLFLDDGRGLLTVNIGKASWLDPRTGRDLRELPSAKQIEWGLWYAIAFGADGKHLVVSDRIYDVPPAQPVSPVLRHRLLHGALSAAFSPDGKTVATGSGDRTVRLWSVPEGKPQGGPLTHATSVSSVAYSPAGRHLATAQRGGVICLWALQTGNPGDYRVPVGSSSFVRLSRDGRFLLPSGLSQSSCELRSTRVIDLATGRCAGPTLGADGYILDAEFSPDGLQVAAAISRAPSPQERFNRPGQQPGEILLWDWRAGRRLHEPLPLPSEPRQLDYSPDGRQLAVIGAKGELVVIDPAAGTTLRQWQAHPPCLGNPYYINNGSVRFGPEGRTLLTFGTPTNSVRVWDASTGRLLHELKHEEQCEDVQFSPDGRLIATAARDNQVCVWELATGEERARLAHPDWTFTALFSPDGTQLLTACRDGMARLWDWRAGRLVCPPFEHDHEVHAVAFTPDGRHVLSASDDGVLKVWNGVPANRSARPWPCPARG
jgi:WD40 repeat protein/serine/threonine protein kinase